MIEKLGATAINYKTTSVADYVAQHTDGSGFEIVFDSVGGANMANSFEAATLNGQVASTVAMVDMDLSLAHFKGLSLHVVFMLIPTLHNVKRAEHGEISAELTRIADLGNLTPVLDENRYSSTQTGSVHERLSNGLGMGKVVVDVSE